jgi:hypothetical protein
MQLSIESTQPVLLGMTTMLSVGPQFAGPAPVPPVLLLPPVLLDPPLPAESSSPEELELQAGTTAMALTLSAISREWCK